MFVKHGKPGRSGGLRQDESRRALETLRDTRAASLRVIILCMHPNYCIQVYRELSRCRAATNPQRGNIIALNNTRYAKHVMAVMPPILQRSGQHLAGRESSCRSSGKLNEIGTIRVTIDSTYHFTLIIPPALSKFPISPRTYRQIRVLMITIFRNHLTVHIDRQSAIVVKRLNRSSADVHVSARGTR